MSLSPMIGISNQLVNWKCFSSSYSPVPFPLLLFFVDGLTSQNLALLLTHLDPKVLSGLPQTLLYQCADTAFSSLPSLLMETYVWAGGNPVPLHFRAFGYLGMALGLCSLKWNINTTCDMTYLLQSASLSSSYLLQTISGSNLVLTMGMMGKS
jgi:hypothetical protein